MEWVKFLDYLSSVATWSWNKGIGSHRQPYDQEIRDEQGALPGKTWSWKWWFLKINLNVFWAFNLTHGIKQLHKYIDLI